MKKTIKQLHIEANMIVSSVFTELGAEINNVYAGVSANNYNKSELYFGLNYSIKINRTPIFGDVNAKSYDEALEKLKIKANFDKENYINTLVNIEKRPFDIEVE